MKYKTASLRKLKEEGEPIDNLPFSIRILLENVLRHHDNNVFTDEHLDTLIHWNPKGEDKDIPFVPARVLMQDFTGVPAIVDLASLRAEFIRQGKDGSKINPVIPVDLIIDHSVQVDYFGTDYAYRENVKKEYARNAERYELLKWAQKELSNFRVVPPGMGICHQINLEYLCQGVVERDGWVFPDTLVGTDSHTPMVNGIGVLAWGVGGIEAEAAMLGQPIYFTCPQVIGLELKGKIPAGATATDMVLTITRQLREYGVVGKFVEVFGDGLDHLSVPDRATIANMSPEFGCTITYFPFDRQTLEYMRQTNRSSEAIGLVEEYARENLLWRTGDENITYSDVIVLDLGKLQPTLSGPRRPQDKILLKDLKKTFSRLLEEEYNREYVPLDERKEQAWLEEGGSGTELRFEDSRKDDKHDVVIEKDSLQSVRVKFNKQEYIVSDGSIVIAAITSCTNTSNPDVMIGAGLIARKAVSRGLRVKSWVKTSLAPGSKVVYQYLQRAGLLYDLEALRFHTVGYGCTTCIGNSGPLPPHISEAVGQGELIVSSVLSGNRNFEARVHPQVRMNFLMSPMLVVAFAIAGRIDVDLIEDPLGFDPNGQPVYLRDLWPSHDEIRSIVKECLEVSDFEKVYGEIFDGDEAWQELSAPSGENFKWHKSSTYVREAPFFENISSGNKSLKDIKDARVLLYLGDSVTTDHISPAGSFDKDTPAGQYLIDHEVSQDDFNSYGSRRGNHEIMLRGTFANVRIKNRIADKEGGYTVYFPSGKTMSVFDAAMKYCEDETSLIVLAGKEYGSGSSRDWAAKGAYLLGIKAVIAESFERIHRSNLVGMGILPLEFTGGQSAEKLGLKGTEAYSITGLSDDIKPYQILNVSARPDKGDPIEFEVKARLDSGIEINYYKNEGILQYVLRDYLRRY